MLEIDRQFDTKKIPHTGDNESLDRCGSQDQYFFGGGMVKKEKEKKKEEKKGDW